MLSLRASLADVRKICLKVIPAREEGGECHNAHAHVGEDMVLVEVRDNGLHKDNDGANHLRYGLDLTKHGCRNNDAALACDNESEGGNTELAKEDDKHYPNEHEGECGLTVKHHPNEDGDSRADDHKLVSEGVDKLTKVGNEIILSRNFAVEHIGQTGQSVNYSRHYTAPNGYISHKEQSSNEHGNEQCTYKRERVRNVHFLHNVLQ